jgi:hypothetical protein
VEGANLIDVFPLLFYPPLFFFYFLSLGVGVAALILMSTSAALCSFDFYFHALAFTKPYSSTKRFASSEYPKSTIPESE